MLAMLFDKLGGKPGFLRDMLNQLLVIKGNTQFLGNQVTHRQAAGAVLSADGNNLLCHICCLLAEWLLIL